LFAVPGHLALGLYTSRRTHKSTTMHPARRWTKKQAWNWYSTHGWKQGANYVPRTATNQVEMWREATWNESVIRQELEWAAELNFNAVRVFLHHLLWEFEGIGFLDRVDRFLQIAASSGISSMIVLFDGCWDPFPHYGPQPDPRPHVHNSRWLQSPGRNILLNYTLHDTLRPYVEAVVRRYGNDSRVLAIDLFNEPDNANLFSYGSQGTGRVQSAMDAMGTEMMPEEKAVSSFILLKKIMTWARSVGSSNIPLTVGLWAGTGKDMREWTLNNTDVISFHNYDSIEDLKNYIKELPSDRPLLCTEYMARPMNSTFGSVLEYFHQENMWAFNWGLVSGKSQPIYPWDSWIQPCDEEPTTWFHDVLRSSGIPYNKEEASFLLALTPKSCDKKHTNQNNSNELRFNDIVIGVMVAFALGFTLWAVCLFLKRKHLVEQNGTRSRSSSMTPLVR